MVLGYEIPRIFTPPKRELTEQTTHGFAAIAFAELVLGVTLFPWQKWLLIHALELNETNELYRFRTVVTLVGRQAGKTLVMLILALWHIYALDSRTVIGTAQDLINAEKAWQEAVDWARGNADLDPLIEQVYQGHPKRLLLSTGCEYRVASATRRGGRGFSGDLILLDELREHQSWDSWAAVTMTMNARPKAQAWAFSNAGETTSVVLRYLRALAHRSLDWPDGDADKKLLGETDDDEATLDDDVLGWFEWSAPVSAARSDREAWAQANPSLNHTEISASCITERTLEATLSTSPAHVFEVECLCRWPNISDGGPFPSESWGDTADTTAQVGANADSVVCLEIPADRSRAYLARAAVDMNGKPVVGIWADRPGTDWVVPYLTRYKHKFSSVVIRTGGGIPAASLASEIESADIPFIKWSSSEVPAGCAQLFDALRDRTIRHLTHPALDSAATSAATRVTTDGGWVIDAGRSPTDTAPLTAAIGAVWGLAHLPDNRPSIYSGPEGADVFVLS